MNICYVIDDDPIILLLARRLLQKYNLFHSVEEFKNGHESLIRLQECVSGKEPMPVLIILDINMPVMDGWTLLDEMQKHEAMNSIPVVILTSSIDQSDHEKAGTYPQVLDFISKPLKDYHIQEILNKLELND